MKPSKNTLKVTKTIGEYLPLTFIPFQLFCLWDEEAKAAKTNRAHKFGFGGSRVFAAKRLLPRRVISEQKTTILQMLKGLM